MPPLRLTHLSWTVFLARFGLVVGGGNLDRPVGGFEKFQLLPKLSHEVAGTQNPVDS